MNVFQVWLRPLGDRCGVWVDGMENAKWLLDRLSQSFVFKTAEPLVKTDGSAVCSFKISYHPPMSRSNFERLLAAIPELQLIAQPE